MGKLPERITNTVQYGEKAILKYYINSVNKSFKTNN